MLIRSESNVIRAADLFCGAGGASQGLARACERTGRSVDLVAVNHWARAVETHQRNHPWARHYCCRVESLIPLSVVRGGRLDLIVAGVECTHHSRARGGKPMSDQSRASAWHVLHWAEALHVREVLIENVVEFTQWGPLDEQDRPIPERRGQTFAAFVSALESLGYTVEWRVLTAADYGDPTTRRRFFLRATKEGEQGITWPDKTHSRDGGGEGELPRWRPAREIIDWTNLGTSIFNRERPLADRTIARIAEGIRRFCGEYAEPFLVMLYGTGTARSVDRPLPTVTAQGEHVGLVQPQPFILPHDQFAGRNGVSLVDSVERPLRTVTAKNGACNYLVSPFILPPYGERPGQSLRLHSTDQPLPTVTAVRGGGELVTPFLVPYYGTGVPDGVDQPLAAVTTKERWALAAAHGARDPQQRAVALDIYFRMLQPRELARAQGFGDEYEFAGTKAEVVRQIGNAIPVSTAENLCLSILDSQKERAA